MNIALICFVGTLLGYILAKPIYRRLPYLPFAPAILVPCLIMALLMIFHVPYTTYMQDNHWIVWMLGPTTVAFAIPIYEYRDIIKQPRANLFVVSDKILTDNTFYCGKVIFY